MAKVLIAFFVAMSCPLHAAELEPLKQFVNRKPLFLSDKNDIKFVASRCSALYLVLSSRAEGISELKELRDISREYADRAVTYDQVREIVSKVTEPSTAQQKEFARSYADITLTNWKQSGDLFKGIINDDLDVCLDNYAYFKKLAVNLSKDIKK